MKMTPKEFYDKAEWEGGLEEAVFGYGLGPENLDDSDPELKEAIRALKECQPIVERAQALLFKYEDA